LNITNIVQLNSTTLESEITYIETEDQILRSLSAKNENNQDAFIITSTIEYFNEDEYLGNLKNKTVNRSSAEKENIFQSKDARHSLTR
jgi:hypothetical protein